MSQQTYLAWCADEDAVCDASVVSKIASAVGVEASEYVFEAASESHRPATESGCYLLGEQVLAVDLPSLYREGYVMDVHCDFARLGDIIAAAVEKHIPHDVRGDFSPDRTLLKFGLSQWPSESDSTDRSAVRVAVACWSHGIPYHKGRTEKEVRLLKEVIEFQHVMESAVGSNVRVLFEYAE